jgi:hypothetical protein
MAASSGIAQISTVEFPVLRNTDEGLTAALIQDFCNETIRLINAHPALHRTQRVLHQGVHRNVQLTLAIYLEGQGKPVPSFVYPDTLDLNIGTNQAKLEAVRLFEINWLEALRASVSQDNTQNILDSLAAIPMPRVPLDCAVVLAYTGKVARFVENSDSTAFAKIAPKQVNAALMRAWWPDLRHLLEDSGNSTTDTWESILRRLSGFAAQAEQARLILQALNPPAKRPLLYPTPPHKKHQPESDNKPAPTIADGSDNPPESKDSSPPPADMELECTDCSKKFTWLGKDQVFYASRGYHQPKRCKPCNEARKASSSAPTSTPTAVTLNTAHTRSNKPGIPAVSTPKPR